MEHSSSWSRWRSTIRSVQWTSECSKQVQIFSLSSSDSCSVLQSSLRCSPMKMYTWGQDEQATCSNLHAHWYHQELLGFDFSSSSFHTIIPQHLIQTLDQLWHKHLLCLILKHLKPFEQIILDHMFHLISADTTTGQAGDHLEPQRILLYIIIEYYCYRRGK